MAIKRIIALVFLFLSCVVHSAYADYPYSYSECTDCINNPCEDKWSFYKNNCTSYVAWRLNNVFQNDGKVFYNYYKNIHWGNANNWISAAKSADIVYDHTPRVGSVAWFEIGTYGHVAYVEEVNSDGTVNIAEYNKVSSCKFSRRSNVSADYYIHIFDTSSSGWVSVQSLSISPSAVVIGKNFNINFTLRETNDGSKTFDDIAVAILDANGNYIYDSYMRGKSLTISACGAWSETITTYLYSSRSPGTYQAIVRGKLNGKWFDFDTTGLARNPREFIALSNAEDNIPGDINKDGKVNALDYSIFLSNFGKTECGNPADFTGDCNVDIFDYNIIFTNYGYGK